MSVLTEEEIKADVEKLAKRVTTCLPWDIKKVLRTWRDDIERETRHELKSVEDELLRLAYDAVEAGLRAAFVDAPETMTRDDVYAKIDQLIGKARG